MGVNMGRGRKRAAENIKQTSGQSQTNCFMFPLYTVKLKGASDKGNFLLSSIAKSNDV
jgi:hypothetical protein